MSSEELRVQNELADALLSKLERIKALWDELPSEEALNEIGSSAESLARSLQGAKATFADEEFPSEEALNEIGSSAESLARSLQEANASE